MDQTFKYVAICVFKIVWWFAAAWLLVGVFRAVVIFENRSIETRFLQASQPIQRISAARRGTGGG